MERGKEGGVHRLVFSGEKLQDEYDVRPRFVVALVVVVASSPPFAPRLS